MQGPRRAGAAALVLALVGAAGSASADGWYFRWVCSGACAPDQLDVRGTEGPYGSESDCERARTDKRFTINSDGSAGSADECYSDSSGGGGGGASGTIVRAAVLARVHLAAVYGAPWKIEYANGTHADVGPTTGGELAFAFGREVFGFEAAIGVVHAPGARETPSDPLDPIWAVSVDLGLTSSPFAIVRWPELEVRPDLGLDAGDLRRVSCERCDFSLARKSEPNSTFLWRARVGFDVWLGKRRNTGFAIEAIYQRGRMGGDEDLTAPTSDLSAKLTPPPWMLRLSFLHRGAHFAAY